MQNTILFKDGFGVQHEVLVNSSYKHLGTTFSREISMSPEIKARGSSVRAVFGSVRRGAVSYTHLTLPTICSV
eukprot:10720097-Karenia_brevis.AAC.1